MQIKKIINIKNPQGLHARPAALLVQIANKYGVKVTLKKGDTMVDGRSIMGILMLEAGKGSKIEVIVEGDQAKFALAEIEGLLENENPAE